MRQSLSRYHPRSGKGQALILAMLVLPLFFSICALVVDGTNLMVNKRQMQNASDAAALAAGQELVPAVTAAEACAGDSACLVVVQGNAALYGPVASKAQEYVEKNWRGSDPPTLTRCGSAGETNCWSWPYQKDIYGISSSYNAAAYHYVQVKLKRDVDGFFASLAGIKSFFDVTARAVASTIPATGEIVNCCAEHPVTNPEQVTTNYTTLYTTSTSTTVTGGAPAMLFAKSSDPACGTLHLNAHDMIIRGAVISNGGVDVDTNNQGDLIRWGAGACNSFVNGSWNGGAGTAGLKDPNGPTNAPFPVTPPIFNSVAHTVTGLDASGNTITVSCIPYTAAKILVNLAPGLYCSTGTLEIGSGLNMTGVGFVATNITLTGSTVLRPYMGLYPSTGGLLLYATAAGSKAINMKGINNDWTGGMFAPLGEAHVTGKGSTTCGAAEGNYGFIEAFTISFGGDNAVFCGSGPPQGGTPTTTTTTYPTTTITTPTTVVTGTTYTTTDPPVTNTVTTGTTYGIDE